MATPELPTHTFKLYKSSDSDITDSERLARGGARSLLRSSVQLVGRQFVGSVDWMVGVPVPGSLGRL